MTDREEESDLNELDDVELEREKTRESLRGSRQERRREQDRADHDIARDRIDDGIKIALVVGLLLMVCGAVGTLVVGLVVGDARVISAALVGLGILGRVIYRLLQRAEEDHSDDPS